MDLGKQKSSCLLLPLFVCSNLFFTFTFSCGYNIQELRTISTDPTAVVLYSAMDVGTQVKTLDFQQDGRKRRSIANEHDILMFASSSNYDLIFVNDTHEVVVKNCLQNGDTEFLAFYLNASMGLDCGTWILQTNVEPSTPIFNVTPSVNVSVSSCKSKLDVIELEFNNGGNCSSWNCSVSCTNDAQIFWIEGRTVRSSAGNISFNFTYEIKVTCFDDRLASMIENTTGDATIEVTFVDLGDTCTTDNPVTTTEAATITTTTITTTETTMSTASNQGVTQQQESIGFFQSTANVALLSFFGGVLVGITISVLIYMVAKHYACKSAVGNSSKH